MSDTLKKELLAHKERLNKNLQVILTQIGSIDHLLLALGEKIDPPSASVSPVVQLISGTVIPPGYTPTPNEPTTIQMIEQVLPKMRELFTINEIFEEARMKWPWAFPEEKVGASFAATFWKYAKDNLKLHQKGEGRRPSIYSRK